MIVSERTSQRLARSTRFTDIRELDEVDSTNRYLGDLARGGAPEGVVAVANHQSAGRGRLGRTWDAPPGGALLASILLRPALHPQRRWLVTAATALAAADACGPAAQLKWPNDLLIGDRKLAGILAEADSSSDAIVVGFGINVAWAPPGAASLGPAVDRGELLAAMLANLEHWCDRWDEAGDAYRGRCATVGRQVSVELPGGPGRSGRAVIGRAEAVEADGRLRVVAARDGTEPGGCAAKDEILLVSAADVVHIRAAENVTDP